MNFPWEGLFSAFICEYLWISMDTLNLHKWNGTWVERSPNRPISEVCSCASSQEFELVNSFWIMAPIMLFVLDAPWHNQNKIVSNSAANDLCRWPLAIAYYMTFQELKAPWIMFPAVVPVYRAIAARDAATIGALKDALAPIKQSFRFRAKRDSLRAPFGRIIKAE